jgi:hypothetical protein
MKLQSFGAPIDEVDGPVDVLEVSWKLIIWIFTITPGHVISASLAIAAFGAACLVLVVATGMFGVIRSHTVAECMTLADGVVASLC